MLAVSDPAADVTSTQTWRAVEDGRATGIWTAPARPDADPASRDNPAGRRDPVGPGVPASPGDPAALSNPAAPARHGDAQPGEVMPRSPPADSAATAAAAPGRCGRRHRCGLRHGTAATCAADFRDGAVAYSARNVAGSAPDQTSRRTRPVRKVAGTFGHGQPSGAHTSPNEISR